MVRLAEEGLDSAQVARAALDHDVVLAPGNVFSTSQTAAAFMRFNVAHCGDPRVMAAVRRAMQVPRKQAGSPL